MAYIRENLKLLMVLALAAGLGFLLIQWTTNSLEEKNKTISALEVSVKTKDGIISDREGEIAKLKASHLETTQATNDLRKEILDSKKKSTAAEDEARRQLAAINEKYKDLPRTAANIEKKEAEIASTRGKGLWASLCVQEPANPNCSPAK